MPLPATDEIATRYRSEARASSKLARRDCRIAATSGSWLNSCTRRSAANSSGASAGYTGAKYRNPPAVTEMYLMASLDSGLEANSVAGIQRDRSLETSRLHIRSKSLRAAFASSSWASFAAGSEGTWTAPESAGSSVGARGIRRSGESDGGPDFTALAASTPDSKPASGARAAPAGLSGEEAISTTSHDTSTRVHPAAATRRRALLVIASSVRPQPRDIGVAMASRAASTRDPVATKNRLLATAGDGFHLAKQAILEAIHFSERRVQPGKPVRAQQRVKLHTS